MTTGIIALIILQVLTIGVLTSHVIISKVIMDAHLEMITNQAKQISRLVIGD